MSDTTNTDAARVEYPDGSTPPVDSNGVPILEDRSADFPDEAADATVLEGRPVKRLGPNDGTRAPLGLMAKRAARLRPRDTEVVSEEADEVTTESTDTQADTGQGQDGTAEAGTATGTTNDTSDTENEPQTGADGSADEDTAEDERSDGDSEEDKPTDQGYEPSEHTVAEVQAYLSENPDQTEYVIDRERTGKARTTLIGA